MCDKCRVLPELRPLWWTVGDPCAQCPGGPVPEMRGDRLRYVNREYVIYTLALPRLRRDATGLGSPLCIPE